MPRIFTEEDRSELFQSANFLLSIANKIERYFLFSGFKLAYSSENPYIEKFYRLEVENDKLRQKVEKLKAEIENIKKSGVMPNNSDLVNSKKEKGEKGLIKLRYGQGQIIKKVRIRKKDNSKAVYYEGRYRDESGKSKSIYAKTQEECLKLLREAHPSRKNARRPASLTVREWILIWFENFRAKKIRQTTKRAYESDISLHILPALGKYRLRDLNGEILQEFFNNIKKDNTRKKIYTLFSSCLEKAVILQKIPSNPCKVVELPKYRAKKRRAFTYKEQRAIMQEMPAPVVQVFFFLCVTGLRVGEFLALRKSDFFFDEHFFKVDSAIAAGIKGEPKTETSKRIIYYTDELFNYFDLNLLGKFKTYKGLRSAFDRLIKKRGISGVSLHSARHTFASVCHSLGMNEKTLQTLLGHATLAMTQDTYTHLLKKGDSPVRNYIEKLCTIIRTII